MSVARTFVFVLVSIAPLCVLGTLPQQVPSASPPARQQCLYVADLQVSSSGFELTSNGRLMIWNGDGLLLTNFSAVPTALAVDRSREILYIASLGAIQGYLSSSSFFLRHGEDKTRLTAQRRLNIAQNLSRTSSLCPCTAVNELTNIRWVGVKREVNPC